jgi:NAD(P)-dependent dehydrogenase (short-subunit alcohol dehydrogenase family)
MPSLAAVRAFNDKTRTLTSPLTAVFVGGTSGIGRATLVQLAKAKSTGLKVYIIGRNRQIQQTLLEELQNFNPEGDFIFLEAQITQLAEVKRVCNEINSKEKALDLLWMSAGALPFDGRKGKLR